MFQDGKSRRAVRRNYVICVLQMTVGGFWSFIFGLTSLSFIINMFKHNSAVTLDMTLIILAIFAALAYLTVRGFKRKKIDTIYYYYLPLLARSNAHSIDDLAAALKKSADEVKSDLEILLKKGFLASAYIDYNTNYIIHIQNYEPDAQRTVPDTMEALKSDIEEPKEEFTEVICKSCGAANKFVKGSAASCEYCGSVLSSR
jgi:ribosomal protein S27E